MSDVEEKVQEILRNGEAMADETQDQQYPSCLVIHRFNHRLINFLKSLIPSNKCYMYKCLSLLQIFYTKNDFHVETPSLYYLRDKRGFKRLLGSSQRSLKTENIGSIEILLFITTLSIY